MHAALTFAALQIAALSGRPKIPNTLPLAFYDHAKLSLTWPATSLLTLLLGVNLQTQH